jgi:hypothetical protein
VTGELELDARFQEVDFYGTFKPVVPLEAKADREKPPTHHF